MHGNTWQKYTCEKLAYWLKNILHVVKKKKKPVREHQKKKKKCLQRNKEMVQEQRKTDRNCQFDSTDMRSVLDNTEFFSKCRAVLCLISVKM